MNKKKIVLPILLLALGVGGFVVLRATRPQQPPVAPQERVWRVETVLVTVAAQSPTLTLNGLVESPAQTQAAAPGVGRVARVWVREGQAVKPGQPLLELDARDFQPRVDQARGEVEELQAAIRGETLRHAADLDQLDQERKLLGFAEAEVNRFERLQQAGFYSPAAVDRSRETQARQNIALRSRELAIADHEARLAQLKARLTRAQANLDQAVLALARSRVQAPFAGYVARVEVAEGDQVATGQPLLALYPSAGLEVRAKIPAPQQAEILAWLTRNKRLDATAELGGDTVRLRLARMAGAADPRGLDGFFALDAPHPALRVGSLLTVHLEREPVPGAVALPFAALYGGRTVYKVEAGRLKAVAVEVLGERGGAAPQVLVRSTELRSGDRVLATHLPNAVGGLRVEAARAAPEPAPAGSARPGSTQPDSTPAGSTQ